MEQKGKMLIKDHGGVQFCVFPHLEDTGLVVHGFSTRHGGVSVGPYATLNMGVRTTDDIKNVWENRKRLGTAIGYDWLRTVNAQQVHGWRVATVTEEDAGKGAQEYVTALPETDAMITDCPQLPLVSYHADCVPVFILDPVRKAIGLAHAGWRGTVTKIAQKTVIRMAEVFGVQPDDCLVGIGPSIGPCCYEVDQDVVVHLQTAFPAYWEELVKTKSNNHYDLDLWLANKRQLLDIGVREENIVIGELCTACHRDLFFSHRAFQGLTGRLAAVMMLI